MTATAAQAVDARSRCARPGLALVGSWLVLALAIGASAIPRIDQLGLYYDEAFLAAQARDFVTPERAGLHPGSVRSVWILGRPLPLRNAAYLGSLKSQLMIPSLAIFGTSSRVVRITTLATGLIALLLCMLFARRVFGLPTALLTGLLIASDACFYFFSQFEWGPFTTNLSCRMGGLYLLAVAWQTPRRTASLLAAASGGALLGLGVFSRADFALVLAACGVALLACYPALVRSSLRERRQQVAIAVAALLLFAAPMLLSLRDLLTSGGAIADRGDLGFRAGVLLHVLDGSQFGRVLQVGGLFERAAEVDAPASLFPWLLLAATVMVSAQVVALRRHAPDAAGRDGRAFLLASSLLLIAGMLLTPGAVRAHHQLNSMPFLQLLVASVVVGLWQRDWGGARTSVLARGLAAAAVVAILASNARVIADTHRLIEETGGRGRFSRALDDFAASIDRKPDTRVVSLDWGFHEPLLFLTHGTRLYEAIWAIPIALQHGRAWVFESGPETIYLVHDVPYDLFGLGPDFLSSARQLAPGEVLIESWRDRQGAVAFYTVRIMRPHRLVYSGRFSIQ